MKIIWGLTFHKSQSLNFEKTTINIGEQQRKGMLFTTVARVKYLNGQWFQLLFSYDRYEKMEKLIGVTLGTVEENSFRLIAIFAIDYILSIHIFYLSKLLH